MKTYLLLFCCLCSVGLAFAQNQASDFTGNKSGQARNPRNDLMNFVPNEVLVKFKDAVPMAVGAKLKAAGISSIDKVLAAHGITSLEKLFPAEKKPLMVRMMKSPQGKDMKIPALDKIYKISVPIAATNATPPTNIFQLIEELKALPEVEYAEPNYIYSIDNMQPVGPVLTAEDVAKLQITKTRASFTPNDPLYSQQGYIQTIKVDSVWQQTQGDSTQIIAILDTGVDWNHPDLKNKIWTNPNPDITNDIRGWDFVNNDNNPMDDNSHGTHVAGIAAAETNNGIGIAGICPKAKIMPIKVLASKGGGDIATIVKGINYAATHGATVINMSFGGTSYSSTLENSLLNAYSKNISLVAGAGNDAKSISEEVFYPAALSFVLGVQNNDSYSNYDSDGPIHSEFKEGYNYELKAPGTVLSTVPNGNYRIMSGTSMSTPIVSGCVALYKSFYKDKTTEDLWSNLINSSNDYINLNKAIFYTDKVPILDFVSYTIDDSTGDNDGIPDAGETISLIIKIKNAGYQSNKLFAKIISSDIKNIHILNDSVYLGSLSTYASVTNTLNPFSIKIDSNSVDGISIPLNLKIWDIGYKDTLNQIVKLNISNGSEILGVLDTTLVLKANRKWVVNNSLKITYSGHLILQAGSKLVLNKYIINNGIISGNGKKDSLIVIDGQCIGGTGKLDFQYTSFNNMSVGINYIGYNDYRSNNFSGSGTFVNCSFSNLNGFFAFGGNGSYQFDKCLFQYISSRFPFALPSSFVNCKFNNIYSSSLFQSSDCKIQKCDFYSTNSLFYGGGGIVKYCNFVNTGGFNINLDSCNFSNSIDKLIYTSSSGDVDYKTHIYWGSTNDSKISKFYIHDFKNDPSLAEVRIEPKLSQPTELAHGFVWKVLINGKDAMDEAIDPLGVGKQRFEIYFNRAMDKSIIPTVSFGVKFPYNQQVVNENGVWSNDGKIFTVYKTISLTTGDGTNRIRVLGAREANGWDFEIPIEDQRFNFVISAANSASLEFMASAGLGKVKLEWNNSDLEDGLGYNLYRMEHINDSTLTEAVMINPTLITDTLYTDYSVTPNKKYYYYYKVLRTNMSETDPSKVVSATPFTASKGDANGDLSVNVLDITTIVAYLLNNNPQPFIFEAADVNSDAAINVLDIVGVVNKVLYGAQKLKGINLEQQANLYLKNDTLFADVNVPVGGIQFDMSGVSSIEDIKVLQALQGFESGYSATETGLRLLYYSISGKSVPAGTHIPLLVLKKGSKITDAIFGGTNGSPIRVNFIMTRIPDISNNMNQTVAELGQNFPNPLNGQTTIPIRVYEPVDEVLVRIVNMMGQEVEIIRIANPYIGEHLLSWNPGTNKGLFVYTLEVRNGNQKQICPNMKMIVQ
ncbi:MAG: S8 family serine peptidase [Paludibacter sp.]